MVIVSDFNSDAGLSDLDPSCETTIDENMD